VAAEASGGLPLDHALECVGFTGEDLVDQADAGGVRRAEGHTVGGERPGRAGPDPAGQHVGPVLRSVQTHAPVVRVEYRCGPQHHSVGPQPQHDPTGTGVACHGTHDQLVDTGDDLLADIVDRDDVVPGLAAGAAAASMTLKWRPLEKGRPPRSSNTRVSCAVAWCRAPSNRRHCAVDIAPL
jgi:hypothetical protein